MSTNTDNHRTQLTEIAKAIGAILGAPLALFAVVNSIIAQPIISLIVALITAVLMSVWAILSRWVKVTQIITAWLALTVVVLAGFVIWPRTMTVEGFVRDAAGNPICREEVVCFDQHGQRYETTTDAEGHYQFTCVPTGKYKLRVRGNEVEGETKGFLVRVVQQNLTVSEMTPTASPTRVAAVTPNTPTPFTDFEAFDLWWHCWEGYPSVSPGRISLVGPADIQTHNNYESGNLTVTVKAEKWVPDTSIGFEIWDSLGRHSIRVSRGRLIAETPEDSHEEAIPDWSALRAGPITFEISWSDSQVELHIGDQPMLAYTGPEVPTRSLKVRLRAAEGDVLTVTQVEVK